MDEPRDDRTKGSKSDRERQTPHDSTYMWNLNMAQMTLPTKQKRTHRQRTDFGLPRGRECVGEKDWEFEINRCKLVYTGWVNNKALL